MVSAELTARRFAGVVRLQVSDSMPQVVRNWIAEQLQTRPADTIVAEGLVGMSDLLSFDPAAPAQLMDVPHVPVTHPRLRHLDADDSAAIFTEIQGGDILLHHPHNSFDTSVLRFLESSARDPQVLAIKLTIYRTSRDSPIIKALTEAAQRGKQVAVLVEITARFDEAPNIAWGEQLEGDGAHVTYGVERLKTHVKLGMVVREEAGGLRRYVHFATGNYHTGTARLYEDLGVLSCDEQLGTSVAAVFNELTAAVPATDYGNLLVAPKNLRQRFAGMIQREDEHCRAGRPCGIRAKMNQLQDKQIIRELYQASQAGVPISLNVRGICCMRAGVSGLSPTIRVFSTLGRSWGTAASIASRTMAALRSTTSRQTGCGAISRIVWRRSCPSRTSPYGPNSTASWMCTRPTTAPPGICRSMVHNSDVSRGAGICRRVLSWQGHPGRL